MNVEWDSRKAAKVLADRGLDFGDAAIALIESDVLLSKSKRQDEDRYVGLVEIQGKVWAVVHLWRGETLRIVTARRARTREERAYRELHPRRAEKPAQQD